MKLDAIIDMPNGAIAPAIVLPAGCGWTWTLHDIGGSLWSRCPIQQIGNRSRPTSA